MSKKIDVSKAASWSTSEAWDNVHYLEDRGRYAQAREVRREKGFPDEGFPAEPDGFTPDPHQSTTSLGSADAVPGDEVEGTPSDDHTFEEKDEDENDEDQADVEGSADWVRANKVETVVEWVEQGETDAEISTRAKTALDADQDTEAGGKERSTLAEELEAYLPEEN